jgi:riboflavin kinase/FMN adenylyltransferase
MKVIRQIAGMPPIRRPVCLAAGFFDGLHMGHQAVLRRAMAQARAMNGQAWAMTFDPHPLKVLCPGAAPLLLTDTLHKLDLLRQSGLDGCLLIRFTRRFAATPAETFLRRLGRQLPMLRHIFVGGDWRFGRQGEGDVHLLETWARPRGITVHRIPAVRRGGAVVSSTRTRDAIRAGNLTMAARLLGRPFSILGTVKGGNRIGRQLGYPTANLDPHNEVRPPTGVYAVRAVIGNRVHAGILNYGRHPTIAEAPAPLMELHVLDRRLNLYGHRIEVFFVKRLRKERQFGSAMALVAQIRRDIVKARQALAAAPPKKSRIGALQTRRVGIIVRPKQRKESEERE